MRNIGFDKIHRIPLISVSNYDVKCHFQVRKVLKFSYDIPNNLRFNLLSANLTKWSNTLKQFVSNFRRLFECVGQFCRVGAWKVSKTSTDRRAYLELYQISVMELFCRNSSGLKAVKYSGILSLTCSSLVYVYVTLSAEYNR